MQEGRFKWTLSVAEHLSGALGSTSRGHSTLSAFGICPACPGASFTAALHTGSPIDNPQEPKPDSPAPPREACSAVARLWLCLMTDPILFRSLPSLCTSPEHRQEHSCPLWDSRVTFGSSAVAPRLRRLPVVERMPPGWGYNSARPPFGFLTRGPLHNFAVVSENG